MQTIVAITVSVPSVTFGIWTGIVAKNDADMLTVQPQSSGSFDDILTVQRAITEQSLNENGRLMMFISGSGCEEPFEKDCFR